MVNPNYVEDFLAIPIREVILADFVGRTDQDVRLSPIRLPARIGGITEQVVRFLHPVLESQLELVDRGGSVLVPADPEILYELLALRIGRQGTVGFFFVSAQQIADRPLVPIAGGAVPVLLGGGGSIGSEIDRQHEDPESREELSRG